MQLAELRTFHWVLLISCGEVRVWEPTWRLVVPASDMTDIRL